MRMHGRITPHKPHFFKPILPGNSIHQELLLPPSFLEKFVGGEDGGVSRDAVLVRSGGGKRWPVKITGRRIHAGWTEFARDHDFAVGGFLVFQHLGGMVFDVTVFDQHACSRQYPDPATFAAREEGGGGDGCEKLLGANGVASLQSNAGPTHEFPYFLGIQRSDMYRLYIPINFVRENGLANSCYERIILRNEAGNTWTAKLKCKNNREEIYIGMGWSCFRLANGLKSGDTFKIELVNNSDSKPIFNFCAVIPRAKQAERPAPKATPKQGMSNKVKAVSSSPKAKAPLDSNGGGVLQTTSLFPSWQTTTKVGISEAKQAGSQTLGAITKQEVTNVETDAMSPTCKYPYFVATLTQRCLEKSLLKIPKAFSSANGLCNKNCDIVLKDEHGRSWPAKLRYMDSSGVAYIAIGWRYFALGNELQLGEYFTLELIEKGNQCAFNFYGKILVHQYTIECEARGM